MAAGGSALPVYPSWMFCGTIHFFFFFLRFRQLPGLCPLDVNVTPVQRRTSGAGCALLPCVRIPFLWMCLITM